MADRSIETDENFIIHLAGPPIRFDGVQRQRCMWCGGLIDEHDMRAIGVEVDGSASEEVRRHEANEATAFENFPRWEGLVAVSIDGTARSSVEYDEESEDGCTRAPTRSCMKLLPRLEGSS